MVQNLIKHKEEKIIFQHFFLFSKTTRELSKHVFWTSGYVLGAQKKVWKSKTAKRCSNLGSEPILGGLQPFTGDFGGHRSTKFNQTQGRKNYFSTKFFYLAKLLESSLKMYFGPLGTSWGLRKKFGSLKQLKNSQI